MSSRSLQTTSSLSPATYPSWRFGGLTAADFIPTLQQHLQAKDSNANWQLVWLNNDGRPVIGLLPKVSWRVYHQANTAKQAPYQVITTYRDTHAITTATMGYNDWQKELINYSEVYDTPKDVLTKVKEDDNQPSYHHGLIGFIGYDIAACELSPAAAIQLAPQLCASLGHYDIYLTANTEQTHWQLSIKTSSPATDNVKACEPSHELIKALITYLDKLDGKLSFKPLKKSALGASKQTDSLLLDAQWSKVNYQHAFNQTQNYLEQGDCYQINLTQGWIGLLNQNCPNNIMPPMLSDYLPALYANTQAPFAGYVAIEEVGNTDNVETVKPQFELLSCSPELFFTFTKDNLGKHHIRTKPIKGTMPRGKTAIQDADYKQQLITSEKDRAENVMIVDLLRNDLGRYAKIGSVKVPQLFAIESFSNVHHMVSTITAELKTDTHPLAVLFGSLPAGSITGTPKKRAVEIIAELEAAPRGAYCGTLGYMNFDGSGQWNVLIRTLQASTVFNNTKQVSLWAGGGITVGSNSDAEYQECLDKVGNLLNILSQ